MKNELETKLTLKEAKTLILIGSAPTLFIIAGIIIGFIKYKDDINNANLLMGNMIAIGCFISFYLVGLRLLNKYLNHFSKDIK